MTSLLNGRWIAGGALTPYLPGDPTDPMHEPSSIWNSGLNDDGGVYYYYSTISYQGCAANQYYFLVAGMEVVSNRKYAYRGCDGSSQTAGGTYVIGNTAQ